MDETNPFNYISTLNTIFYLKMAPAELVHSGIFVACDCLINEVELMNKQQNNKRRFLVKPILYESIHLAIKEFL